MHSHHMVLDATFTLTPMVPRSPPWEEGKEQLESFQCQNCLLEQSSRQVTNTSRSHQQRGCFTLECGQRSLQAASAIGYWLVGVNENGPVRLNNPALWKETGWNTLQFFNSRSVPIIAAGLQQRGMWQCTTTFVFGIFHKLFGVSINCSGFLTSIWIFSLYKYEKLKGKVNIFI